MEALGRREVRSKITKLYPLFFAPLKKQVPNTYTPRPSLPNPKIPKPEALKELSGEKLEAHGYL